MTYDTFVRWWRVDFEQYFLQLPSALSKPNPKKQKNFIPSKIPCSSNFSYFRNWNPVLLSPRSKNKKTNPEKICYASGNWNPPKNSYSFSKNAALTFQETENLKNSVFQETSYFSGNNFESWKNEKTHS